MNVSTIGMVEALYISGARICRVGFFGMKMPIGIAEPLIDNLVQRYLDFLTPELDSQILHNKSIFDIGIGTLTKGIEFFSFGDDQRRAKQYSVEECTRCVTNSNLAQYYLGQRDWCKSSK